jgi:hypothetical protein
MAHKTGFTPKSLNSTLLGAGFKSVGMLARDSQLDIWAIATKKEIESKDRMMEIVKLHLPVTDQTKI